MVARGKKLRTIRESMGMSQESLAWRIEVSQQTVSRVEAGMQEPRKSIKEEWSWRLKVGLEVWERG